jgi:hypothetical protein
MTIRLLARILAAGLVCLVAGGCARVEYSGFLRNYEGLHKIGMMSPDEECVYSGAAWGRYRKVRVLRIEARVSDAGDYRVVQPQEVQSMTEWFRSRLSEALGRQLRLTNSSGPDVLEVHAAITRLRPSVPAVNAASWFVPFCFLYTSSYTAVRNTTVYQGEAGVEIELRDSRTQARLYEFVGMRFGSILDVEQITRWGTSQKELNDWAQSLADRLWALRCGQP